MNRRRSVLFALACAAATHARAQPAPAPAKMARVGLLRLYSATSTPIFIEAMRELGWVEGRNVVYDYADADGDPARLPQVAAALVARRPEVIHAANTQTTQAAFGATRTIPIVFSTVPNPIELGLVKTFARPGGNVTGVAPFSADLGTRRMQLLIEMLPRVSRVGLLVNATMSSSVQEEKAIKEAAGSRVKILPAAVKTAAELPGALSGLHAAKAEAILLTQNVLFLSGRKTILEFAAKYRIAVVGHYGDIADDGALMSYNSSLAEHQRRAAYLVDKVLRGAKPAELPVEQPTKFELVINMKAARALGITIPQSVLLQASRVIE